MIHFLGQITLTIAILFAFCQSLLPLLGLKKNNHYLQALARPCCWGQFIMLGFAYVLLTYAFYINDFSIAYVGLNSHPTLPLMYQLTAVWGGHEGSILLWIFILNIWSIIYSIIYRHNLRMRTLVLAILGVVDLCFLIFLLFTSNPFASATIAMSGSDLNPLLQDIGFISHPPMLYAGYVGSVVAFAITLAALIRGELNQEWAKYTRCFAIAAWSFLTLGITLGSWWAYRVLGWGGFWFWDPVENISLLPWLSGLALIHVLVICEKNNRSASWAAILALITFALSLLGTFLVRSGILVSAHTFASDPKRGLFLLILFALCIVVTLYIYIKQLSRQVQIKQKNVSKLFSREWLLTLNSLFIFGAMLIILLGTLYPLILDALHLGAISVGAPYFNLVMQPIIFCLLFFMAFAPTAPWHSRTSNRQFLSLLRQLAYSLLLSMALFYLFTETFNLILILSLSLCIWVMMATYQYRRILPTMSCAHIGFVVLIIGVMLSSFLTQEKEVLLQPGDTVALANYHFLFIDTQRTTGPNYHGIKAGFEVMKKSHHIINLYPEKRIYSVRDMVMTKVEIHPGIFRDLYIALGEPFDNNIWSVRIYYKPFVRWIWAGGVLMLLGGLLTLKRVLKS